MEVSGFLVNWIRASSAVILSKFCAKLLPLIGISHLRPMTRFSYARKKTPKAARKRRANALERRSLFCCLLDGLPRLYFYRNSIAFPRSRSERRILRRSASLTFIDLKLVKGELNPHSVGTPTNPPTLIEISTNKPNILCYDPPLSFPRSLSPFFSFAWSG